MGTMWPKSGSYEFDSNGVAADGALAYFYQAGTSTPLTVYSDGAESTPHEDPVEADGNGRWPLVFVPYVATYKFILKTSAGTTLFTADNVPNPEPFDETFELDETAIYNTGDFIFVGKNGTRTGAVRCNGRTMGNATSGGTERANADTSALFAYLWNNYANGQAAVSTGRGASAAADYAAHKTITLPNYQGCALVGFDDMGATAGSFFTSAPVVSGSAILAGSILGGNTHVLLEAQLAAHTHTFSATTGAGGSHVHALSGNTGAEAAHTHTGDTGGQSVTHTHTYVTATEKDGTATGFVSATGTIWHSTDASGPTGNASVDHSHPFTTAAGSSHVHALSGNTGAEAAHTHTVSGTSGSTGSATAHNIMQRSAPVTILMKL